MTDQPAASTATVHPESRSPSTVVVVTSEEDTTASRITAELAVRGVPVARFDVADFPARLRLTAATTRDGWRGSLAGTTGGGERVELDLADVASVYYRRPGQVGLADGMSGAERRWAYGEARRGLGGVLQALDPCLWVNDPVCGARCEYKPVQLAAATRCGLAVPRTLVTNDPDEAAAWAWRLDGPFVYKPLAGTAVPQAGRVDVLYTTRLDDPEQLCDPALALTAHLFQEWVPKAYEARAVVVGEQVFTVAIHTDSEEGHVDWRSDYDALRYRAVEPPAAVRNALVRLHRALGLVYGAVDLVVTPEGDWVFLETNQSGEWGWLAHECDLPIAAALAELLAGGARR